MGQFCSGNLDRPSASSGWSWSSIDITNTPVSACGTFVPSITAPPVCGTNEVLMGDGICNPYLTVACMYVSAGGGCNTCKYTRDEWINMGGGNVIVNLG